MHVNDMPRSTRLGGAPDQVHPARSIENLQEHVTSLALQLDALAVRLSALENRLTYNGDQS